MRQQINSRYQSSTGVVKLTVFTVDAFVTGFAMTLVTVLIILAVEFEIFALSKWATFIVSIAWQDFCLNIFLKFRSSKIFEDFEVPAGSNEDIEETM